MCDEFWHGPVATYYSSPFVREARIASSALASCHNTDDSSAAAADCIAAASPGAASGAAHNNTAVIARAPIPGRQLFIRDLPWSDAPRLINRSVKRRLWLGLSGFAGPAV